MPTPFQPCRKPDRKAQQGAGAGTAPKSTPKSDRKADRKPDRKSDRKLDRKADLDLSVRQHERLACSFDASLVIAPEDEQRVRFAPGVLGRGLGGRMIAGGVPCRVVDCSPGGFGLHVPVFLPRKCRAIVRFDDGFHARVRVRRIIMADRQPTYYIGCSFEDRTEEHDRGVADLLRRARAVRIQEEEQPDARV